MVKIGASGMPLPQNPFDCTYTADNGKIYSYGAETVLAHIVQSIPASVIANALLEYVMEAPHQGWEGFSRQDVSSIRKFFRDFALVVQDFAEPRAHVDAWVQHKIKLQD